MEDFFRVLEYSKNFYFNRIGLLMIFSIPFIFAFLIPILVSAPTYTALGGVFLRTGSIPDLTIFDIIITALGYAISFFLAADAIVNVNLLVRSKRTITETKTEMFNAIGNQVLRLFYVYTLVLLFLFVIQLFLKQSDFQQILYPIILAITSFYLFYITPSIAIDNNDIPTSIAKSAELAKAKPHLAILWTVCGFILISLLKLLVDLVVPTPYSTYVVLIINSLIVLPFLIILQTQMYMEKYPLAR